MAGAPSGGFSCGCPISKNISVSFTAPSPAPGNGYLVKWRRSGSGDAYTTLTAAGSPVTISNVPVCTDIEVVVQSQCDNSQLSAPQTTTVSAYTANLCDDNINLSHTHNGFYTYPEILLDATSAPGDVILTYDVIDRPNRISVYNTAGNLVVTSGWKGIATYPGPWGASLNTATSGTVTIPYSSDCYYRVLVESVTNSSYADTCNIAVTCPTTGGGGGGPVDPTITLQSCSAGFGTYRIDGTYNTNFKIALSASGNLTNTDTNGSCARLEGVITSSTGPSTSSNSSPIVSSGSAAIGAGNTVFLSLTIPNTGYLTINTSLFAVNSSNSGVSGQLEIFEVNGTAKTGITQSVCSRVNNGVVGCGTVADNYQWEAIQCSTGNTTTLITDTNLDYNGNVIQTGTVYKSSPAAISECYTILSYVGLTTSSYNVALYSTVTDCNSSSCVQL